MILPPSFDVDAAAAQDRALKKKVPEQRSVSRGSSRWSALVLETDFQRTVRGRTEAGTLKYLSVLCHITDFAVVLF